ncbi:MAG TPA: TetR/AcrR family transcriptional regulator [Puia sp.]|jgi:AcrR family transcriptional regulator|nr:TetR/AcrR family transcriptional regulator [Puia sp.]
MNKAEKTKQFIVERTAPIFNKKGYAGTSISDMTDATGLTKGSIYGNFANKDEVALAAFDYNVKKVTSLIRAEMDKKHTVREKLLVYVDVYNGSIQGFPEGGCPILNTAVEADDTHDALKKKVVDVILTWKSFIMSLLQQGIEKKEFKEIKDPEQTALSIISTIEGGIMVSRVTGRPQYRRQVMEYVEKMIRELK